MAWFTPDVQGWVYDPPAPRLELAEAMEFVRTQLEDMAEDERANGASEKARAIERRIAVLEAGLRRTLAAEGRWP